MFKHKFILSLLVFTFLNVFFYTVILFGNNLLPFNKLNYFLGAHHFFQDTRISNNQSFNLLRNIGAWDGQWYLKIASTGYPKSPNEINMEHKNIMDGITYSFFPLYPLTIKIINIFLNNVELSAFVLTNIILVLNFSSLYYFFKKTFSEDIAVGASALLWTSPFGIFFRIYYTEGLFLFLLIWFTYFIIKNKLFVSAILLGLLSLTKGNGLFLFPVLFLYTIGVNLRKKFTLLFLAIVPLAAWLIFCYINTGNFLYFLTSRGAWGSIIVPFKTIIYSINYPHEIIFIIIFIYLFFKLIKSSVPPVLKLTSFVLFLAPLLVFTMSFSRSQIISFPLLIYPASRFKGSKLYLLAVVQFVGLCLLGLGFINWNWVG